MNFDTLLDVASSYAQSVITVRQPDGRIHTITYPQFVTDVRRLVERLKQCGLKPGVVAGIHAAARYEFLVWDLALITLGIVPHVMPEGISLSDLLKISGTHRLAFAVSELTGTLGLALDTDIEHSTFFQQLQISDEAHRVDDLDILSYVYSSGTTGRTKGLIVSRSGAQCVAREFAQAFAITEADRHLVFLPLSHFQQRLSFYTCLAAGVSFMLTPYTHVFQDLPRFAPSFLIGPPAFYEAMLNVVVGRNWEVDGSDRLRSALGPNLRFMITGMAPIRHSVLEAYRRSDIQLLEAYGITEAGLVAWNTPQDNVIGTVGRVLHPHRIELSEDSEVVVHTDFPLCKGYFDSNGEDTRTTFLSATSIATGDIGEFVEDRLRLRGRKKDIIITGGGFKFHPSEIEQLLLQSPEVRQAAIFLDDNQANITAVISVDDSSDLNTIGSISRRVDLVNSTVESHKKIAQTMITSERFTVENSLLTRNMKLDRAAISRRFVARKIGTHAT